MSNFDMIYQIEKKNSCHKKITALIDGIKIILILSYVLKIVM